MGKIYAFILGAVFGFGMHHLATTQHIVRAGDGLHLVPKVSATLADTYVDIRGFTAAQWSQHSELGIAIARSGNTALQEQAASGVLDNVMQDGIGTVQGLLKPRK